MDAMSIALALAMSAIIIYALNKLKLLSTLAVILLAVVLLFLVMAFVPALQVEPVYSLLKGFFEGLPDMVGKIVDYVTRLIGGLT